MKQKSSTRDGDELVTTYVRSRFGVLLAVISMVGHMVLMVPMAAGWLVCLQAVTGRQLRNTRAPSTPVEWCLSGFMCVFSVYAAYVSLAETKTLEVYTRSQERFRSVAMAAVSIAPLLLGALTLDPYPAMTMPSVRTLLVTTLLSVCWLGLAWLRFRQMNSAKLTTA
jgi:hypothetical protein